jgi:pyruvate ferredoxin oxidoreductase alpha subunit
MAQTKREVYSVIAGIGGQEVTYDDISAFIRKRRIGEEFWFGVTGNV